MKSPEKRLKRWLHPVVFASWTGFLIYLLVSHRYVAYLRPEFGLLLALAHFIAMGFMLAAIMRPVTAEMDMSAVLRALVLLVPILYSTAMPDTLLGNQAFKKRFMGIGNGAIGQQAPSMTASPGVASLPGDIDGAQAQPPQELTILDIYLDLNSYKGQRVTVTGMILRDERFKPHFGGRDTAVYRFLITCCAADALPLAMVLDSDAADVFAKDQWVQVDGILDLQQINGRPVPIVAEPLIKPVEAPAEPYLF